MWRHFGNVQAERVVDTLAVTLSEKAVEGIGKTLGNEKSKEQTHALTDAKENAETRRRSDKLANKKAKSPLTMAGNMITVAEVEIRLQQLKNMEARALLGKLVNTSRKSVGRDTWRHTG